MMNLLIVAKRPAKMVQEIKDDLWQGYSPYMQLHGDKILRILKGQNKKKLLDSTDLQTAIATDDYFLTDLDIWVLATQWNLPIILFTVWKIKLTENDLWSFLTSKYDSESLTDDYSLIYDSVWFIRSSLLMDKVTGYPAYSLVESPFQIDALNEMGQEIRNGIQSNVSNLYSLERFLQKKRMITVRKKGTK